MNSEIATVRRSQIERRISKREQDKYFCPTDILYPAGKPQRNFPISNAES
jgi:hypothetical protein